MRRSSAHTTSSAGSALGWKVNADLPEPARLRRREQFVTPEHVAESLACGPDVEAHVDAIKPYVEAGFTEVALVQIGAAHQDSFIRWAESELLPAAARAVVAPAARGR